MLMSSRSVRVHSPTLHLRTAYSFSTHASRTNAAVLGQNPISLTILLMWASKGFGKLTVVYSVVIYHQLGSSHIYEPRPPIEKLVLLR